jgi:alpha-N-arabinofuranosidase
LVPVSVERGTYSYGDLRLPRVDVVAARDASGRTWLALTNIDPNRPAELSVGLPGVRARAADGQVLTAPAVDSHNSFDQPNLVHPAPFRGRAAGGKLLFNLPPKSVAVVQLR